MQVIKYYTLGLKENKNQRNKVVNPVFEVKVRDFGVTPQKQGKSTQSNNKAAQTSQSNNIVTKNKAAKKGSGSRKVVFGDSEKKQIPNSSNTGSTQQANKKPGFSGSIQKQGYTQAGQSVKHKPNNKNKQNITTGEYYPTSKKGFKLTANTGDDDKNKHLATEMLKRLDLNREEKQWLYHNLIEVNPKDYDYYDLYKLFAYANVYNNEEKALKQVNLSEVIQKTDPETVEELKEIFDSIDFGITWYKVKPEYLEDLIEESKKINESGFLANLEDYFQRIAGRSPDIGNMPKAFNNTMIDVALFSDSGVEDAQVGNILNPVENEKTFLFWLWCFSICNNENYLKRKDWDFSKMCEKARGLISSGWTWDNIVKEFANVKSIRDIHPDQKGRGSKVTVKNVKGKKDDGSTETFLDLQHNEFLNIAKKYKGSVYNIKNEEYKIPVSNLTDLEYIKKESKKNQIIKQENKNKKVKNEKINEKEDFKREIPKKDLFKKEVTEEEKEIKKNASIYETVEEYFGDDINFIIDFFNTSANEKEVFDKFISSINKKENNGEETRSWNWHDLILAGGISRVDSFEDLFYQISKNIRYLKEEKTETLCDLLRFFFTNFNSIKNAITSYLDSRAKTVSEFIVLGEELLSNDKLDLDSGSLSELVKRLLSNYSLTDAILITRELEDVRDVFNYKRLQEIAEDVIEEVEEE
jgi:hypothetical protein